MIASPSKAGREVTTDLSGFTGDGNGAVLVVFDRRASLLDECAVACGSEEGRHTCATGPDPLR